MRFYTTQPPFYCGIDWHARRMDVCLLRQDGAILGHRHRQAAPAPFLQALAPSRAHVGGAGEGRFPGYGLAALCAHAGRPFVLGQALSLQALPGGQATNDTSDAHTSAGLLRGGLRPAASGSPAAMRATRARWRRRMPRRRKRAELLAPVPNTKSPDNLPELGKQSASPANRDGVAARWPAPAVHQSLAVALALLASSDQRLPDLALPSVPTATAPAVNTFARRRSLPGVGNLLALVRL